MNAYVETVGPKDGKLEDKLVFGGAILILLCAASLLYWLYPPQNHQFQAIPKPIRATLTALSNAGEELQILQEFEDSYPSLSSIKSMDISPFSGTTLMNAPEFNWGHDSNCYIGQSLLDKQIIQIRLELPNVSTKQSPTTYWRYLSRNDIPVIQLSEYCQSSLGDWRPTETLKSETLESEVLESETLKPRHNHAH